ncbi:MAG: MFS transporter [Candidatus Aminicenantes bacterium]|nr:MFS transporter [Candidatus Aminicenantes bacterium]
MRCKRRGTVSPSCSQEPRPAGLPVGPGLASRLLSLRRFAGLKRTLRAMRYRNYRLYFGGQGISLTGSWMQQVAMGWLVYRLTGSAFYLGLVAFFAQVPVIFMSPFSGVLADRWDRMRIMLAAQGLAMVQALLLAFLMFSGAIAPWHLLPLAFLLGTANALDAPARHSFIVQVVERKEDLGNAIALNSAMFNGARLVGPPIAGLLVALTGEGICFLINGISYLAVIFALLAMRFESKKAVAVKLNFWSQLREGFVYTFGLQPIRLIMALIAWISLVGMSYLTLMPVFVGKALNGGPHSLGFLMGAAGCGALLGALVLASRPDTRGLEKIMVGGSVTFSLGLVALSLARVFWQAMPLLFLGGMGMMVQMASANTYLQHLVSDDKRARVMSIYTMAFIGATPIGSFLFGTLASGIGVRSALACGGVLSLAGTMVFAHRFLPLRGYN